MMTAGIITEYNPFHSGHQHLIRTVRRERNADYIIAVMSGDYVQRGEPALFPKHLRAKAALEGGADLVIELPVPFCILSAEGFAFGGVRLLDGLGVVDELCFGSELPDLHAMEKLAAILAEEPEEYQAILRRELKQGLTYPQAREKALIQYLPDSMAGTLPIRQLLSGPNNILGIEYLKALHRLHSPIRPAAILREGSGYLESQVSASSFPSALSLRRCLKQHSMPSALKLWEQALPSGVYTVFEQALKQKAWLEADDFLPLLAYKLMLETPQSLLSFPDIHPGLAARLACVRPDYRSCDELTDRIKTRQITRTHVQRALLYLLLDIKEAKPVPAYARVLGFRKESTALIRAIREKGTIPLVIKPSQSPELLQDASELFASDLYQAVLSQKTGLPFRRDLQISPVVWE